jgi:carbon storage regulator
MLVLSRKLDESIVIDGRIIVKVLRLEGDVVKLGIIAPPDVPVHRQEVYDEIRKSNRDAITPRSKVLPKISPAQHPLAPDRFPPEAGPSEEPTHPES